VKTWSTINRIRIGSSDVSCEQSNESSGSIKGEKFLEQLRDSQLLKKWNYHGMFPVFSEETMKAVSIASPRPIIETGTL
jgi:hypothetical protein